MKEPVWMRIFCEYPILGVVEKVSELLQVTAVGISELQCIQSKEG